MDALVSESKEAIAHIIDLYEQFEQSEQSIEKFEELSSNVLKLKRSLNKQQTGLQDKLLLLIEYLTNKAQPQIEEASETALQYRMVVSQLLPR